ncbi:uncharacterized protein LOC112555105 [Pomacea canaliculata]|uniref:uncharacterized protein LOC112555105 n=1 Tax=Pomacea canaliculata TaxID=400727 RepID=UPI000D738594|nr:uncharacterized protein LOC112555105 [Pomacea canaliculata]
MSNRSAASRNSSGLLDSGRRSGEEKTIRELRDVDLLNQNEIHDLVQDEMERAEVDWLCEPEWNNQEMEIFWHLLEPHFKKLLQVRDWRQLPDPCLPIVFLDPGDSHLLDRSLLHIQWHIWKGHYSQAVSDFRFVKGHFECSSRSLFLCKDRRDDIENLKLVFRKKRLQNFGYGCKSTGNTVRTDCHRSSAEETDVAHQSTDCHKSSTEETKLSLLLHYLSLCMRWS